MTKSVTNALVGILIGQRRLSLDATRLLPEWRASGDPRGAIAIDHLLRMSSGLRFDEVMASPRSDVMRMLFQRGDAAGFAAAKPLAHAPGTRWQYSSATTNILARVMRHALQDDEAYLAFPRRALFEPIGMASAVMETDAAGTFIGSSYMHATARDWARFGQLYLQDGVWAGTRVLPDGWVAYTTTPALADDAGRYGAHVWLHVPGEYASRDRRFPCRRSTPPGTRVSSSRSCPPATSSSCGSGARGTPARGIMRPSCATSSPRSTGRVDETGVHGIGFADADAGLR